LLHAFACINAFCNLLAEDFRKLYFHSPQLTPFPACQILSLTR
jgi:hypothetical protein